ncbi:MAG TPA: MFS transporter [Thermoplasmata archaeon]|nr:MFS transporter [Thermoplasmata archaeon]
MGGKPVSSGGADSAAVSRRFFRRARIRNPWVIVTLSSAAFFMSYFGRMIWSVFDVYATSLRPTLFEDSLVFSLFFVGYVAVQVPAGLVADRVRPNLVTGVSLIAVGLALLLGGSAEGMAVEYLSSLLMGLAAGWIYPDTVRALTALFPSRERRAVAMGYYSLAWPMSVFLLGIVLPITAVAVGWRGGYTLVALVAILLGVVYLFIDVEVFRPQRASLAFLITRNSLLIAFGGFAFFLPYWAVTLFAFDYFVGTGMAAFPAGLAVAFLALAGIPSTLVSGYVMNRVGIRRAAVSSLILYGVAFLLLAAFQDFFVILGVALAMGFFRFLVTPINAEIVSEIGEERAGHVTGFANVFWQLSGVVAPILAAFVISGFGYAVCWYAMGALVFVAAAIYARIGIPRPSAPAST